jgi:HAMP domain-containing protein
MKTPQQYEKEIEDLKALIRKMKIQLTAALESVAENHGKEKP